MSAQISSCFLRQVEYLPSKRSVRIISPSWATGRPVLSNHMNVTIRRSSPHDLHFIEQLENSCFPKFQQSSRRSLRLSLTSSFQQVYICEAKSKEGPLPVGAMVLNVYHRTLRIYSMGVLPDYQGHGIGRQLLAYAKRIATEEGFEKLSLEAYKDDQRLIQWYQANGYSVTAELANYYGPGLPALRMVMFPGEAKERNAICNLIVVDNPKEWKLEVEGLRVISGKSYLFEPEFQKMKRARIFNLSDSMRYQSLGYYVSLLASARDHSAIPNVTTIRDFRNVSIIRTVAQDIDELLQKTLEKHEVTQLGLNIYFGQTIEKKYRQLAQALYGLFETPLMYVQFNKTDRWSIQRVSPLSIDKLGGDDFEDIQRFAREYFTRKRFKRHRFLTYKYDLAILVNPDEKNPPSNQEALQKFREAAKDVGFYAELITKDDYDRISEFDALFIRETTSVNNYTYHFSRTAYAEGLVVIDDPWSILRCSNKIFLDERMRQNRIPVPRTWILSRDTVKKKGLMEGIVYPLVLKQPDGAFSLGVTKVKDQVEMEASLDQLYRKSDLVIAQEFLPSEFDWRIGILDEKPLYACKYFMARNHWQIVDWQSGAHGHCGEHECVAVGDVPDPIIKNAVKAADLMGDGFYGVDLKLIDGKAYVIEVNDNPSIDAGVEDEVLGDTLYLKIMESIFSRIEMARNMARFVSVDSI